VIAGLEEGAVRWVLPRSQYAIDKENTHDDSYSICWQNDDNCEPVLPAIRRVLKEDGKAFDIAGGKSYEILVWVKTKDVIGSGVTVSLSWNGDMGFLDRVESEPLSGTHGWTLVKIVTPPLFERVYWCRLVFSAKPGTTGKAWFDGAKITE